MHIAQPLLEPHDRLAAGMEAEMAGLDDAGMNRADRDLMQACTFDLQEAIGVAGRRRATPRVRADDGAAIGRDRASAASSAAPIASKPKRSQADRSSRLAGG